MQTLTTEVEENIVDKVIDALKEFKAKIKVEDKNLAYDTYFYERSEQIKQDIEDIDSGKVAMINHDDFWNEMDRFTNSLQK